MSSEASRVQRERKAAAPEASRGPRDRRPVGAVALAAVVASVLVVQAGVATGEWRGVAVTLLQIAVVATTTAWGIWSSDRA